MAARGIEPGKLIGGRYLVQRRLGKGGMSVVLEAIDRETNTRVAIKVMGSGLMDDDELRERFDREAQAVARLTSDHVTRVLDMSALDDGTPFLVMECLDGKSLETILERDGPLDPRFVVDCVIQGLQALAEAHALGLVHRDFKPANLFLHKRGDGTSIVKVLDFGIVKDAATKSRTTETGATMGTPAYMSPEQISSGAPVSPPADVWAAGVTLFELVTGILPFDTPSIPGTLSKILKERAPLLRSVRSDAPESLERVIDRCLAKDPPLRYADANELGRALREVRASMTDAATHAGETVRMPVLSTPQSMPPPAPDVLLHAAVPTLPMDIPASPAPELQAPASGGQRNVATARHARPSKARLVAVAIGGGALLATIGFVEFGLRWLPVKRAMTVAPDAAAGAAPDAANDAAPIDAGPFLPAVPALPTEPAPPDPPPNQGPTEAPTASATPASRLRRITLGELVNVRAEPARGWLSRNKTHLVQCVADASCSAVVHVVLSGTKHKSTERVESGDCPSKGVVKACVDHVVATHPLPSPSCPRKPCRGELSLHFN